MLCVSGRVCGGRRSVCVCVWVGIEECVWRGSDYILTWTGSFELTQHKEFNEVANVLPGCRLKENPNTNTINTTTTTHTHTLTTLPPHTHAHSPPPPPTGTHTHHPPCWTGQILLEALFGHSLEVFTEGGSEIVRTLS